MVTTFFKMSRSISTRLSAARNCLISARSALLGTAASKAWRYQRPSSADEMPWVRATSLCRVPAATWRTHSALKAGVYFLRVEETPPRFDLLVMSNGSKTSRCPFYLDHLT